MNEEITIKREILIDKIDELLRFLEQKFPELKNETENRNQTYC